MSPAPAPSILRWTCLSCLLPGLVDKSESSVTGAARVAGARRLKSGAQWGRIHTRGWGSEPILLEGSFWKNNQCTTLTTLCQEPKSTPGELHTFPREMQGLLQGGS
eukprot:768485-Hanusia_phi.AAC.3